MNNKANVVFDNNKLNTFLLFIIYMYISVTYKTFDLSLMQSLE